MPKQVCVCLQKGTVDLWILLIIASILYSWNLILRLLTDYERHAIRRRSSTCLNIDGHTAIKQFNLYRIQVNMATTQTHADLPFCF